MSDSTIGQIDPYDGMDLGAYRYAVARLLRLLIRARLTQESEFLSEDDRQRWQEKLIEPDSQTIESLLHEVCRANDFLYNQVLGPGNSVGIAPGDSRDQLKENVISVMTSLWSVLDEWIVNATKGEQIKWDDVIPIDSVRLIRDGLDALPKTATDADGPLPPASFRWKDRTAKLTPKPWSLVNFLWDEPSYEQDGQTVRCSDFFTIARKVWDKEDVALGRAINSAASRATGMFEEAGIPIRLSVRKPDEANWYVMLVIADSDS